MLLPELLLRQVVAEGRALRVGDLPYVLPEGSTVLHGKMDREVDLRLRRQSAITGAAAISLLMWPASCCRPGAGEVAALVGEAGSPGEVGMLHQTVAPRVSPTQTQYARSPSFSMCA